MISAESRYDPRAVSNKGAIGLMQLLNAGEQAVIRAGRRIPPYPQTQAYVRNVMASLRNAPAAAL